MLKYLEIFDKKFIRDNNYNLLSFRGNLTDNVIIKCKTFDVVDYIATIILEIQTPRYLPRETCAV